MTSEPLEVRVSAYADGEKIKADGLIRHTRTYVLSSLGVPGVPWHTQILADQLTLFQPRGTDYAHLITTGTPGFSDLPTALKSKNRMQINWTLVTDSILRLKIMVE